MSRFTPSLFMISALTTAIAINSAQSAQGANLVPDSLNALESFSKLDYNLALRETDQSRVIIDFLVQNSRNSTNIAAATNGSNSNDDSPADSSSQNSTGLSLQSLVQTLSQLRWAEKGSTLRAVPVLSNTGGSDINEGLYTFSDNSKPLWSVVRGGVDYNSFEFASGSTIFKRGGIGFSPIQLSHSNQDVEFDLVPENVLPTTLSTAYQTDLSSAVSDLDSKFSLKITTELRLMPDPILLSANNLELENFGTSKLTETRAMSLYSLRSKIDKNFQEGTSYFNRRLAERDQRRYSQLVRDKNFTLSGANSSLPNQVASVSAQSSLNSPESSNLPLSPASYANLNRPSDNFSNPSSNPGTGYASQPLLSNPNLAPQPLKTIPRNY